MIKSFFVPYSVSIKQNQLTGWFEPETDISVENTSNCSLRVVSLSHLLFQVEVLQIWNSGFFCLNITENVDFLIGYLFCIWQQLKL